MERFHSALLEPGSLEEESGQCGDSELRQRQECPRCSPEHQKARLALQRRVYREYPQLLDETLDDFARVTLIRQWAWSHIRGGSPANLLDAHARWYELDAASIFRLFAEDRGGVYCGGSALALQRLYEVFGYRAWSVNNGDANTSESHVFTLVKIRVGHENVICLQDPLFNTTHVDATTGLPVDYFDLLRRLARHDHESFRVIESDHRNIPTTPAWIVAAKDINGRSARQVYDDFLRLIIDCDCRVERLADGSLKFIGARTLSRFALWCQIPGNKASAYLEWALKQGHPEELSYIYLYPLGVSGPGNNAFLRNAKAVAGRHTANFVRRLPTYADQARPAREAIQSTSEPGPATCVGSADSARLERRL